MSYIEMCNKKIGHQVHTIARSDYKKGYLVPVSYDGMGRR